jgi:DNA-binding transcriptional MocR family regulator
LREAGLVASRRGAGSWIASVSGGGPEPVVPEGRQLIDLARASPPAIAGMLAAVDAARRKLADELGGSGYGNRGLPVLREQVARRYTERGLPTTPDQIMVTNGAQHALSLVVRMLADPGDRVLVEQPTYPNTLDAVRAAHALPVPAAIGSHGWDCDGIEATLRQASPRLACLNVDFQNPTGWRLDDAGRERLGAVLARARTPTVFDETLVELDLTEQEPPLPAAAFAGDWAITVGTASKSHWGGLRIGWIRATEEMLAGLSSTRIALDLGSPVLDQLVLAELLADPEPMRRRRAEVRAQREALVAALKTHCPDWEFRVPGGGLSMWCRLPEPMSTRLAVAAAGHGVQVVPSSRFGVNGGLERWLRVPFSLPPDRLTEAVRRLGLAAASVRRLPGAGGELVVT